MEQNWQQYYLPLRAVVDSISRISRSDFYSVIFYGRRCADSKINAKKEGGFSNQTYTVTCSAKVYEKSPNGARVSISAADFEYYLLTELLQNLSPFWDS